MTPRRLASSQEILLALFLGALWLSIAAANRSFLEPGNLYDLLESSVVTGVFALGVLVVLISGGIDISFAAIGAFSMYATSRTLLLVWPEAPASLAFAGGAACGAALGLANGILVAAFRWPALIVTLGTRSLFRGLLLACIGTAVINNLPGGMVAFSRLRIASRTLSSGERVGLSASVLVFAGAAVLTWLVLRHTMLGRGIYALGSEVQAAERVGFQRRRIQLFIYGFAGALAGVAGIVHAAKMRNANPFDLVGNELTVIAAVVLGGASIAGGRGSVGGVVLGVLILETIDRSLVLLEIATEWQRVAVGMVLIGSVAITARRRGWRGGAAR